MIIEPLVDVVELDLRFLEQIMGEGGDGIEVSFPLAGLLTELRQGIDGIKGNMQVLPTRDDLRASEARQNERMARMEGDIAALKADSIANKVQWGKLMGAVAVVALLAGSVGAVLSKVLGG